MTSTKLQRVFIQLPLEFGVLQDLTMNEAFITSVHPSQILMARTLETNFFALP
jgi:hypothetical protein